MAASVNILKWIEWLNNFLTTIRQRWSALSECTTMTLQKPYSQLYNSLIFTWWYVLLHHIIFLFLILDSLFCCHLFVKKYMLQHYTPGYYLFVGCVIIMSPFFLHHHHQLRSTPWRKEKSCRLFDKPITLVLLFKMSKKSIALHYFHTQEQPRLHTAS